MITGSECAIETRASRLRLTPPYTPALRRITPADGSDRRCVYYTPTRDQIRCITSALENVIHPPEGDAGRDLGV